MHDPSHKNCIFLLWPSSKFLELKKISKIENFDFYFENLIFVLKIAIFVSICYSLSLRVYFSTILIFNLTILLSVQNHYPKLSNRTSRLSFCKANFLVCICLKKKIRSSTELQKIWKISLCESDALRPAPPKIGDSKASIRKLHRIKIPTLATLSL